ncbi:MAG TPA: SIR2 family protein [Nitrososphaeraceae archaeon]|nr:SIR2 family protein [Nitrososphaeraceae archaeon]
MLFLGAGSSHSFNVPIMGTFVDDIANSLQEVNPPWREEIMSMKKRLLHAKIEPAIEIIMTALSIWSDSAEIDAYRAPFLAMTDNNIIPRHELSELLSGVKEQIYQKCLASNISKATKAYDKLFEVLQDIGHAEFSTENGKKIKRLQSTGFSYNRYNSIINKIFTTNYDPIIEASIRNMNKSYSDGFYVDDQGDLSFQNQWDQQKEFELIKLHGSIDYYSKDSRKTVKYALNTDSPHRNIYGEKLERMMILPIGEKYVTKSPYIDMNKLRHDLFAEEVVVSIGYS